MVTQAQLENYTEGINKISLRGREAAKARIARLDYSDMTKAIDEMVKIMEGVCATSADAAGELGAVFYAGQSMMQTGEGFNARSYPEYRSVATEKAVRGIAQLGVNGDFDSMLDQLLGRVDFEVKRAAGYTVMRNAEKDSRRPRFARVIQGYHTCSFCVMLSSRGVVYHTAESAGFLNHYHPNCDCRIVPVWGSRMVKTKRKGWVARDFTPIEGYDPSALFDDYLRMVAEGKRWAAKSGWAKAKLRSRPDPSRLSVQGRMRFFNHQLEDSLRELRGAANYEDFMARAQNVAMVWDDLRSRINANKDARRRKVVKESWDNYWRRLNIEAGVIREDFIGD